MSDAKFSYLKPSKSDAIKFVFTRTSPILETSVRIKRDDPFTIKSLFELCSFAGNLVSVVRGTNFGVSAGVLGTFVAPVEISPKLRIYFLENTLDEFWTTVESQKPARAYLEYATLADASHLYLDHLDARIQLPDGRLFVFRYSSLDDVVIGISDNTFKFDLSGKPLRGFNQSAFKSLFGLSSNPDSIDVKKIISALGTDPDLEIDLSSLF